MLGLWAGRALPLQVWCTASAVALALALGTGSANAAFGVSAFDGQVTADAAGNPFTQAGGHPYAVATQIDFNTTLAPQPPFPGLFPWPDGSLKDLTVDVPPGLIGNPTSVEQCTMDQLAVDPAVSSGTLCPTASQVGVTQIATPFGPGALNAVSGVYSMVPPPSVPARLGFKVLGVVVLLDASLRSDGDYGLSVNLRNASQGLALLGTKLTIWGIPADPAHDPERGCPGSTSGGCTSQAPMTPFWTLPTRCTIPGVGLETKLRVGSWENPGDIKTASFLSHLPPDYPSPPAARGAQQGPTGCGEVPFDPTFTASPLETKSPGASGWQFDLTIPQDTLEDPDAIAQGHLKKAVVTLPEGVRVSPSAANGLGGCTPAQIGLDNTNDPSCPNSSKIGVLRIDTPLLEEPLDGSIYLATPHDNPSNSLVALYLVAKGPGLIVKLPGTVTPSATDDGQLTATFNNSPQVPFSKVHLEFSSGSRAPLSNPPKCGTYTTHAVLTSWSGKSAISDSSFTTSHDGRGAACPPAQFSPHLDAGAVNPVAGKSSPFGLTLSRDDDDDELKRIISVATPNGLLARIASIEELCPAAQMTAGTCAETSRIGTVTAAAGPGPSPFAVQGRVYLGGPYKSAPFSLSIVVPVKAGPFDLGTVVVRSAINVDRHTAELDIDTDPLPTVLQGIPLQVRLVNVMIDRAGFMLNPTSCAKKQIRVVARATTGRTARLTEPFQVGNCAALDFAPRMDLKVGGKGHTRQGRSTPFTATLRMPKGGANLDTVSVTLPDSLNARLDVVNEACTRAEFDAGNCEKARAGTATAVTPLLKEALRGGAYFVKRPEGGLPNLVVALRGQVDFDLVGKVTIPGDIHLATKFDAPDVPVTKFVLKLVAGKHGPVGVAANLCSPRARRATAKIAFTAQNRKRVQVDQRLDIAGCAKAKHLKRSAR